MRHDNTITEEAINLLGRAVSCFKTAFFRTAGVRHLKCSTPECVQIVYMSSQVEEEFMERDVLQVTKSPSHQVTKSPSHQVTKSPSHQVTKSPRHCSVPIEACCDKQACRDHNDHAATKNVYPRGCNSRAFWLILTVLHCNLITSWPHLVEGDKTMPKRLERLKSSFLAFGIVEADSDFVLPSFAWRRVTSLPINFV